MKKLLITSLILSSTVFFSGGCSAKNISENAPEIILTINKPIMVVNGVETKIDDAGTMPVIINDTALLPIRAVIETMGGDVEWDGNSQTVTLNKDGDIIKLTINSNMAVFNNDMEILDTSPVIINDITMMPIRFIAERFGFNVGWNEETQEVTINKMDNRLKIKVGDKILTATLEKNSSADALMEMVSKGDVVINMSDYGNFEKVGALGENLPRNDEQTTTQAGDLILYQGNSFVIYYDTNSWNFTRLGKINDITQSELKQILGDGDVTVTLSAD